MTPDDNVEPDCYSSSNGGPELPACRFTDLTTGYWLSGTAYGPAGSTDEDAGNIASAVSSLFAASAAAEPAFSAAPRTADAWPAMDCGPLSSGGPERLGLLVGFDVSDGNGPAEMPAGFNRAAHAAGRTNCVWQQGDSQNSGAPTSYYVARTLPGAAWIQDEIAAVPGPSDVLVPGVDRAILTTVDEQKILNVFDGSNWLLLEVGNADDQPTVPIAAALAAELNKARDNKD